MQFWFDVLVHIKAMLPMAAMFSLVNIPFIALEQIFPARERPRPGGYLFNFANSFLWLSLAMPLGMIANKAAQVVHQALGLEPFAIPLSGLGALPAIGPIVSVSAMIIAPLLVHDLWFYWSHRLEHQMKPLWEFHSLHHSDRQMNCTTSSRDHFLQNSWRSFFSIFTLGLLIDVDFKSAGEMAMLSTLLGSVLSMFYHSAIRIEVPWLDKVIITPQVHRIHHSTEPEHYNKNFGDFFPYMDMIFGTYEAPKRGEFPATGLGDDYPPPRDPFTAQLRPLARVLGLK